jgi:hypothetical protein
MGNIMRKFIYTDKKSPTTTNSTINTNMFSKSDSNNLSHTTITPSIMINSNKNINNDRQNDRYSDSHSDSHSDNHPDSHNCTCQCNCKKENYYKYMCLAPSQKSEIYLDPITKIYNKKHVIYCKHFSTCKIAHTTCKQSININNINNLNECPDKKLPSSF